MVIECILVSSGSVDNTTGLLNTTQLKKSMIETSSLSIEHKKSGEATIDSCLLSNFTLSSLPLFIEEPAATGCSFF